MSMQEQNDATLELLPGATGPQGPAAPRLAGRYALAAFAVVAASALTVVAFFAAGPLSAPSLPWFVGFQHSDGEQVCEGHGFSEGQCLRKGCCHYDNNFCWSSVGNGSCTGPTTSGIPDGKKSGEDVCQNQGLGKKECLAISCCHWDDGECWSGVGSGICDDEGDDPDVVECDDGENDAGDITVTALPDVLANGPYKYGRYFVKYVSVFGVPIMADEDVPDWKVEHAGDVLAHYLDYDGDGKANNGEVLDSIHHGGKLVMFKSGNSENYRRFRSEHGYGAQDINDNDIPSWVEEYSGRRLRRVNGSRTVSMPHWVLFHERILQSGPRDGCLEEILHMIYHWGYARVYYDALGEEDSKLAQAMEKQIGDCGHAYDGTSKYPNCTFNFYRTDKTCNAGCNAAEYQWVTLVSLLGGLDGTVESATGGSGGWCPTWEWKLCSKKDIMDKDPDIYHLYDLDGANPYKLPDKLPSGRYRPHPKPKVRDMELNHLWYWPHSCGSVTCPKKTCARL
ncbi:unnamed protein product [Prorocentrum cordatum]|uniref:Uncharacterized protein n=1 Tax=Prorocentrum cordatum TaxID=2364126 RepID=A0ABN9V1Y6_9DINO|nr:unnamed protein product [Polarella glacialis]